MPAPPLKWTKNSVTGVVLAVAGTTRYVVREGHGGRFYLTVPGRAPAYTASGSKELCKAVAAWDAAGSRPEDRPAFFARRPDESPSDWVRRLAAEEGMNPREVVRSRRVMADGRVSPAQLAPAAVAQLVRDTYAPARHWADAHNERVKLGQAIGFVVLTHADWLGFAVDRAAHPSADTVPDRNDESVPARRPAPPEVGDAPRPRPDRKLVTQVPRESPPAQTGKDRFGCRLNTGAALINAVLTAKPQTAQEIEARAKAGRAAGGHLARLVKDGLLVKDQDGRYRLPD